jgi:peptide/nickel transport system substrate-binding protein
MSIPTNRPARTRVGLAAGALVSVLALAACGSGGGATSQDTGTPTAGGTLTVGLGTSLDCVDPTTGYLVDSMGVSRSVVDGLVWQDVKTGEFRPWLADSWEISPDGTHYTFAIKKGVTFSDGTPFTAQVAADNLNYFVKLGAEFGAVGFLTDFASAQATGPDTLEVAFSNASPGFLAGLSTVWFGMVSPSTIAAGACNGSVIGTGPFVIDTFAANQRIELTKRVGYTSPPAGAAHTGDAYVDRIDYEMVPDASVRDGSFSSGQVAVASRISPSSVTSLEGTGASIVTGVTPGMGTQLLARVTDGPMADEAVRQALQVAVDRTAVTDAAVGGTPYQSSVDVLSSATVDHVDHSSFLKYDPDAARKILDEAGWTAGPTGVRSKNGEPLSLRLIYYTGIYDFSESVATLLQQELQQVGFQIDLAGGDGATWAKRQAAGDYDLAMVNATNTDADVLRTDVVENLPTPQDKAAAEASGLTALADEQRLTADPATRSKLVSQLTSQMIQQGWVVPLFEMAEAVAVGPTAHGVSLDATSRLYLYDAWVTP